MISLMITFKLCLSMTIPVVITPESTQQKRKKPGVETSGPLNHRSGECLSMMIEQTDGNNKGPGSKPPGLWGSGQASACP